VDEAQRDQLISQFRQRASRAFLRAYWVATETRNDPAARSLLDLFLIEKAAYEIAYEVSNRPTWVGVPIAGLERLVTRVLDKERSQ
jgi:maltose alpha-D-glucosyltransferase / alpha-amylase